MNKKTYDKLYNLAISKNLISWNVAINQTEDSYLAESFANEQYLKAIKKYIKHYPNDIEANFFKKTDIPIEYETKRFKLKQLVWKKYLKLRETKSNADDEYYELFEKLVNINKEICTLFNVSPMYFIDGALGSENDILNIVQYMANVSKDKLNELKPLPTESSLNKLKFTLMDTFRYLDEFKSIQYVHSTKNGSFMTPIDKDNSFIHIKKDERDVHEICSSITHEVGHALYQNLILNKHNKVCHFGEMLSISLHESSSILNEISCSGLQYQVNNKNALYRLGSHKLYYIIHIYIRLQIEHMLFNENLNVRDIPKVWNELVKEYIGIEPKIDFEGFLQDVHWNCGLFGYFQSYAIGFFNAINMYNDINYEVLKQKNLMDITNIVIEKIETTYGHFDVQSTEILKQMYPNLNKALNVYKDFINKAFY